jgi:hypothetical protein
MNIQHPKQNTSFAPISWVHSTLPVVTHILENVFALHDDQQVQSEWLFLITRHKTNQITYRLFISQPRICNQISTHAPIGCIPRTCTHPYFR